MKKILSWFLVIFPIVSSLYIYWPILKTEFNYRTTTTNQLTEPLSSDYGLVIPKIGVNEIIIPGVDPFNEKEYLPALNQGIAQAANSVHPDQPGTTYLFGHSSDNPFSVTRYNTSFYLLSKLETGDQVSVFYQDQEYKYQVTNKQIVKPYQVEVLTESTNHQLILQTCTPVGTSLNRLLVFAQPV